VLILNELEVFLYEFKIK